MDSITTNRFLWLDKEVWTFSSFNPSSSKGLLNIYGEWIIEPIDKKQKSLVIHGEVYVDCNRWEPVEQFSAEISIKVKDLIFGRRKEFLIISGWIEIEDLKIVSNQTCFLISTIISWLGDQEELEYFNLIKQGKWLNEIQLSRLHRLESKIDEFKRIRQEHYLIIKNQNLNIGWQVDFF